VQHQVACNQGCHDTTSSLKTEGQRGDIQEEEVGVSSSTSSKDAGLDGCAIGDCLIGVDGAVRLLAFEEGGQELVDLRNAGGTTHHDNLVHRPLVNLGVAEHLLDRLESATEQIGTQVLEASAGDGGVEVDTLEERVNLDRGVSRGRKLPLGTLASSTKTTHGARVPGHVLLVLSLELLREVVHKAVIEVLTSKVSVTSGGLHLEDAIVDGQEGHIEGTTSKIEDKHIGLASGFLVQTVGNYGCGRLVNNAQDVEASDGTSILGGLTLGVVTKR